MADFERTIRTAMPTRASQSLSLSESDLEPPSEVEASIEEPTNQPVTPVSSPGRGNETSACPPFRKSSDEEEGLTSSSSL